MAKVALLKDDWIGYCWPERLSNKYTSEIDVSEEEERWIWEAQKEIEEVQKFLEAKLYALKAIKNGK